MPAASSGYFRPATKVYSIVCGAFSRKFEWARCAQLNCSDLGWIVCQYLQEDSGMMRWETHVFLALLDCRVAVRIRHACSLAKARGDETVEKAQHRHGSERDANNGAGPLG